VTLKMDDRKMGAKKRTTSITRNTLLAHASVVRTCCMKQLANITN